jgi:LacI family transcriptional regulator
MIKAQKKITSQDIADELGISRSVVSFVLNGKNKEMRISDELTQKVLTLVENRNYQANQLARSLKTGKTFIIGLIVADISNPFFANIAREVELELSKYGYDVVFCSSDENKTKFKVQIENFIHRQVDGLILIPPVNSFDVLSVLNSQNIPFVIIDRDFTDKNINSVNINNHKAAYDATNRLINNDRKRVGIINVNNELLTMAERTAGYIEALNDNGIKINSELIKHLKFSKVSKHVYKAVEDLITNNVDAIIFTTNKLGVFGIQAIREMDKKIPEDIAVISFDDSEVYATAFTSITAVKQPLKHMSKEAVRIILKAINSNNLKFDYEQIALDVSFIVRESCP